MATIKIQLVTSFRKPVIQIPDAISELNTIIDTGAHISTYFGTEGELRKSFPDIQTLINHDRKEYHYD